MHTARHRGTSRGRWLPVIVASLVGVALGAGGMALSASAASSPAPPAASPAPPAAPPQAAASTTPEPQPADVVRSVEPVAFATPATGPGGLSITVLVPEGVLHGVRLTIGVANPTDAPIVVNTAELGPHDQSFNGVPVPMTMTAAKRKLMPGEGYTYQAVITLPTTDVGQLALKIGPVTVAGLTSCGA